MRADKGDCDQELFDQDTDEFDQLNNTSQIDLTTYLGLDSTHKTRITDLNLKDYSKELDEKDLSTDSPFVRLCLSSSKAVVIRKSSLCWLLENNKERISTDRLRRFIVNAKPSIKSVLKDNHTKTPLSEDEPSSHVSNESNFSLHDSPDTESSDDDKNNSDKINVEKKKYYAVMYDIGWYIGRVIETNHNTG